MIGQIYCILQQSTAQPCFQILPLPPMLPQSQIQNISPPKTTNTPALAPRVEPVVKPLRVKTMIIAPISPLGGEAI